MFNALKYTKTLEESGFERDQAEVLVGMFMQMIEFNMVSKSDFEKFQSDVRHGFEKIDQKFEAMDLKFEERMAKLSLQLTVKLGIMLAVSVGLLSTILAIKL